MNQILERYLLYIFFFFFETNRKGQSLFCLGAASFFAVNGSEFFGFFPDGDM